MNFELRIDGQIAVKMEVDPSIISALLRAPLPVPIVAHSAAMTVAEVRELLSRIDAKSVRFLKQIAAQNGAVTWGEAKSIFGIGKAGDWAAFSGSYGKGITRTVRYILKDKSARLVFWDDGDQRWYGPDADAALLFVDGAALQALRQATGVTGSH